MEHDPVDGHKAWKAKLEEKKDLRKKETSATSITPPSSSESISDIHQLKLLDKLQASVMTDLKLFKDEPDRLMTAYNSYF